ncbi:response regulator [uncultured Sphaerochaeta sp.]|uniref:response regulator n=1 Tax=uncultured Sphaerochaeta sp. TaxID=886478 RepID=UPI0029CA1733|nr:response regulator [uncultured Sphaerochaeta sp.]
MIHVVIIDDEPIIIRNIQRLFSESDPDFAVVGSATNGEEGYQLIKRLQPDMACIDISMPILDGIQMAERLREEQDTTPLVIISGYSEFEKAKKAVQLQVLDYLVKPLDKTSFNVFLNNIKPKLLVAQHTRKQQRFEEMLSVSEKTLSPTNTPLLGASICFGSYHFSRSNLFECSLDFPNQLELQEILRPLLSSQVFFVVPGRYHNEYLLVIEDAKESPSTLFPALYRRLLERAGAVPITLVYYPELLDSAQLRMYEQRLSQALYGLSIFGRSSLFSHDATPENIDIQSEFHEELSLLQHTKQRLGESKQLIESILKRCEERSLSQRYLLSLIRLVFSKLSYPEHSIDLTMMLDVAFGNSVSYETLQRQLFELLEQSYTQRGEIEGYDNQGLMIQMKTYLESHYSERIRIQDLAESFGFNYSYLCILFKKYIGESPNEYLIRCRIHEAKALLLRLETMNIKAVAASVGYEDSYYFSRIFRKHTGMTPSEFRKRHMLETT